MTIDELIAKLKALSREGKPPRKFGEGDAGDDHIEADRILLAYINDPRVTEAFDAIEKWYA